MSSFGDERAERLQGQLHQMLLIREFEERVRDLFADNELPGFVHLYAGQEAVATGGCSAIREGDYITSTHRGHGHALAIGLDPDRMMAELFGKVDGYCRGKSGSMHIADVGEGMLGANGIVGAGTALATGAGFSLARDDDNPVCLSFFGEGALASGIVHESINLAAVQELPVVFVCENNMYGEMTPADEQHDLDSLHTRGEMYGIPSTPVDGMDVEAVYDAVFEAVNRARDSEGPTFVICDTYRYYGHYEGDPEVYRDEEEVDRWRERDPIPAAVERLVGGNYLEEEEVDAMRTEVSNRIDEAVAFARESPLPDQETAFEGVYSEVI